MNHQRSIWKRAVLSTSLLLGSLPAFAAEHKVYVANEDAGTVSVIDATTFKVTRDIAVGSGAHNVQVAPDGELAWVTNKGAPQPGTAGNAHAGHGAMAQAGEVCAIDTATNDVVARVVVGNHPAHVVVSADSRWVYVTNVGDNTVSVVDTVALKVVDTLPAGSCPHGIRLSPDGQQVHVANLKGNTVSVIDTTSRQVVGEIAAGKGPAQVGFMPDGRHAYVTRIYANIVSVIDVQTRQSVATIAVGAGPNGISVTPLKHPDGRMRPGGVRALKR